ANDHSLNHDSTRTRPADRPQPVAFPSRPSIPETEELAPGARLRMCLPDRSVRAVCSILTLEPASCPSQTSRVSSWSCSLPSAPHKRPAPPRGHVVCRPRVRLARLLHLVVGGPDTRGSARGARTPHAGHAFADRNDHQPPLRNDQSHASRCQQLYGDDGSSIG